MKLYVPFGGWKLFTTAMFGAFVLIYVLILPAFLLGVWNGKYSFESWLDIYLIVLALYPVAVGFCLLISYLIDKQIL